MPKPKLYTRNCDTCKKEYTGRGKYFCSKKCSNLHPKQKDAFSKRLNGNTFARGKHWKLSDEVKKKHLETLKSFCGNMKGKNLTKEHRKKISSAHKKLVENGKHHLWKGGITPINQAIRNSIEYKLWREAVFKRDNWTCIFCLQRGGELEADHIKRFSDYPELRFAIDNGRTLCKECHKKITFNLK